MYRASSGMQIITAAVIAIIYTLIAQLFLEMPSPLTVSLIGLGVFLGGIITPYVGFILQNRKTKVAKQAPRAHKAATTGGDARTLYVGNLPFKTSEEEVQELFGRYGDVSDVRLVKDRRTGRKKGYGFVEMDATGADIALAKLNDHDFEGRTLKVRTAHADQDKE
ncbi:MAG: RNA-binding protein [Aliidiomarina sp.]|uniref:RNA recognition motif domain-containing protein n=1 Tax=Aliidiomarina sp. TaxID=1872439 RepID=UPI0025BC9525|nr:RNA-binding protein [Aliidiomarina sp.]MCH8502682.1 RNA-binding protein [Aliidiomarina sp.]